MEPAPQVGEPEGWWERWVASWQGNPRKSALVVLGALGIAALAWHDWSVAHAGQRPVVEYSDADLEAWVNRGDRRKLEEVAFSNPPDSLYPVVAFLLDQHTPKARAILDALERRLEGALAIAELAESLPISEALPLYRNLLLRPEPEVRQAALSTLFVMVARENHFTGPWPEGMAVPSQGADAVAAARERWSHERDAGSSESFAEWRYKEAVAGYLCPEDPDHRVGNLSERRLIRQLDAELRQRWQFPLLD
jgi:hypothetical protein